MTDIFDVAVVGGGPVGACAGTLLARDGLKVCVLEPNRPAPPIPESAIDARVVAVSRSSERILDTAGAWQRILGPRVKPYERMRIWHETVSASSADALVFDAADVGEPNLGYIIENRLLQTALLDEFETTGGFIRQSGVRDLSIEPEWVAIGTGDGPIRARLLIGADGARSAVRELVGLTAEVRDYDETAIVATINTQRPHESTAWQRFMRDGTLAFLPCADGSCSIVWSADNSLAGALLEMPVSDFERELDRASDHVLGATRLVSERLPFPLRQLGAHRYVAHRCALIGDAAHVVHPLAGQGVNLGFMDAAVIAELVLESRQEREDPGALRVLRRYERWRKGHNLLMMGAMDGFKRLFGSDAEPLRWARNAGLSLADRLVPLKILIMRHAMGRAGDLPDLARVVRR